MEHECDACEQARSDGDVVDQWVAGDRSVSVVVWNGESAGWRRGWSYYIPAQGEPTGDVACIAPLDKAADLPSELEEATATLDRIARYLDECGAPTEVAHPLCVMRPALRQLAVAGAEVEFVFPDDDDRPANPEAGAHMPECDCDECEGIDTGDDIDDEDAP